MTDNLFMGKNNFVWWFGRVVSNADPLGVGRCRVRIHGWHSENEDILPDIALPWAFPITPITNAGIAGVGISPVGPQPNTKVFGFFADGEAAQQPIMLGVVAGDTVVNRQGPLEEGSTPSQPNKDKTLAATPGVREDDCPDGYDVDTTRTNQTVPDSRALEINPSEWALPFTGFVSSAYAERSGRHHGVDICPAGFYQQTDPGNAATNGRLRGPVGQPVYAAADGVVIYTWTADKGQGGRPTTYDKNGRGSRSFGNAIAIKHTLSTGTYVTIYAHLGLSQDAGKDQGGAGINVSRGQSVKKGQQIGVCGRSHCFDSLTHVHFEIRVGEGLPKTQNHINPGRVFPQLRHRHQTFLSWVNSQTKYNVKPKFRPNEAPVQAKQGPGE